MFQRAFTQILRNIKTINNPRPTGALLGGFRKINTFEPLSALANSTPKSLQNEQNAALEAALSQVNTILAESRGRQPNLQETISHEVDIVLEILQKLVGTHRSLSHVEQIYAGTNHETIHGLTVLLFSKMSQRFGDNATDRKTFQNQLVIAKVVEMINIAMRVHDMVRNIDAEDIQNTESGQTIHLNNKCAVLYGDFMWAKAWKDLADSHTMSVIDQMVTVLVNVTQGQFLLEQEPYDIHNKMTADYWLEKNILVSGCLPAFGCRSVLDIGHIIPEDLLSASQEFGQNFGLYMKGLREVKWFQEKVRKSEPIDFLSLPLILHVNDTGKDVSNLISAGEKSTDSITINYEQIHSIVRSGRGVEQAKARIEQFRAGAFDALNVFPESDARSCLKRILDALQ